MRKREALSFYPVPNARLHMPRLRLRNWRINLAELCIHRLAPAKGGSMRPVAVVCDIADRRRVDLGSRP